MVPRGCSSTISYGVVFMEHVLHLPYNTVDLTPDAGDQRGYGDTKVYRPRRELCWNKKWYGDSLRLIEIVVAFPELKNGRIAPIKLNFEKLNNPDRVLYCKECKKKIAYNPGKIRCKPCKQKVHYERRKAKRALEKAAKYNKEYYHTKTKVKRKKKKIG